MKHWLCRPGLDGVYRPYKSLEPQVSFKVKRVRKLVGSSTEEPEETAREAAADLQRKLISDLLDNVLRVMEMYDERIR